MRRTDAGDSELSGALLTQTVIAQSGAPNRNAGQEIDSKDLVVIVFSPTRCINKRCQQK